MAICELSAPVAVEHLAGCPANGGMFRPFPLPAAIAAAIPGSGIYPLLSLETSSAGGNVFVNVTSAAGASTGASASIIDGFAVAGARLGLQPGDRLVLTATQDSVGSLVLCLQRVLSLPPFLVNLRPVAEAEAGQRQVARHTAEAAVPRPARPSPMSAPGPIRPSQVSEQPWLPRQLASPPSGVDPFGLYGTRGSATDSSRSETEHLTMLALQAIHGLQASRSLPLELPGCLRTAAAQLVIARPADSSEQSGSPQASSPTGQQYEYPVLHMRGAAMAATAADLAAADESEPARAEPSAARTASAAAGAPSHVKSRRRDPLAARSGDTKRPSRCTSSGAVAAKWGEVPSVEGWPTVIKVLPENSVRRAGVFLQLPPALVTTASMRPGPMTLVSEGGEAWESALVISFRSGKRGIDYRLHKELRAVVNGLQLEAGQTICLAALSPRRLLISREGEPQFSAAARQGMLDSWPLTVMLTQSSVSAGTLLLSSPAGSSICTEGITRMPAVIVIPATGVDAPLQYNVTVAQYTYNKWKQYTVLGWRVVLRDLGLKAGDRVQLNPVCRDPWRFHLTVLPAADATSGPAAET